jgi:serine/threonine-protein kinase
MGAATVPTALVPSRYRVVRQIAIGGMASIWLADDAVLGRRVAVKVLAEQLAEQPLFVRRFQREARTAAGLSGHPHVITIYDVGEHDGRPFIVMEYLSGGTVADRIRGSRRPSRENAIRWLREAASALDFAHGHGIVHRDIKPANLLFDEHDRLVLADLGIARAAYEDTLTSSGELLGTAAYLSPEQAIGEPATAASDRYALAVVAYQLLTGTKPFEGANFAEQAIRHVESVPEAPSVRSPELPPGVDEPLLRGLAKNPDERWESASALVDALAAGLEEPARAVAEEPAPARTTLIDPSRDWPREPVFLRPRRRTRALAIAALVLALGGAGAAVIATTGGGDGGTARKSGGKSERRARADRGQAPKPSRAPATTAPAPSAAGTATSPAALNDQGYQLMSAGRYAEAIPVLQRAVAAFPQNSKDLTYAYALYNLGRSLRLGGRPAEAIPILERRQRFPNQRAVVARELAAARRAAG